MTYIVTAKEITAHQRENIMLSFLSNTRDGILLLDHRIDFEALHKTTLSMTDRKGFSGKALDTLHLSAARVMGAKTFITLDSQQEVNAAKEGFQVLGLSSNPTGENLATSASTAKRATPPPAASP